MARVGRRGFPPRRSASIDSAIPPASIRPAVSGRCPDIRQQPLHPPQDVVPALSRRCQLTAQKQRVGGHPTLRFILHNRGRQFVRTAEIRRPHSSFRQSIRGIRPVPAAAILAPQLFEDRVRFLVPPLIDQDPGQLIQRGVTLVRGGKCSSQVRSSVSASRSCCS